MARCLSTLFCIKFAYFDHKFPLCDIYVTLALVTKCFVTSYKEYWHWCQKKVPKRTGELIYKYRYRMMLLIYMLSITLVFLFVRYVTHINRKKGIKMKKLITFCIAVALGTMLFNSPVMSEASKIPVEDKALTEPTPGKPGEGKTGKELTPEIPPVIQKWPGIFDCGPTDVVLNIVRIKYGEMPMVKMDSVLQIPGNQLVAAPVVIYFNTTTKTFSVVAHFENMFSCILLYGQNVEAVNVQPQQREGSGTSAPMRPGQKKFFDKENPPREWKIDKEQFKWKGSGHTDIMVMLMKVKDSLV